MLQKIFYLLDQIVTYRGPIFVNSIVDDYLLHLIQQKLVSALIPYFLNMFGCRLSYDIRANLFIEDDCEQSFEASMDSIYYITDNFCFYELFGFYYYRLEGEGPDVLASASTLNPSIHKLLIGRIMEFAQGLDYGLILIFYHPYFFHFELWLETNCLELSDDFIGLFRSVKRKLSEMAPGVEGMIRHPDNDGAIIPLFFTCDFEDYESLESEYADDALFSGFILDCLVMYARERGYRPVNVRGIMYG